MLLLHRFFVRGATLEVPESHPNADKLVALQEILGAVTLTPTLWLFSGHDEFVPADMDKESCRRLYESVLTHRSSRCRIVEGAPHSLTGCEDEAVQIMINFIKSL